MTPDLTPEQLDELEANAKALPGREDWEVELPASTVNALIEAARQLHEVAEERDDALAHCTLLGNDLDEAVALLRKIDRYGMYVAAVVDDTQAFLDRIDRRKQSKVTP